MSANANGPPPPIAQGIENQPAWRENTNRHLICPDCRINPPDLIEENADLICGSCGRVLEERLISYESEWRTFNNDEKGGDDPTRVGDVENDLLFGNQGTTIGGGGANMSKEARKLKKAQAMQNDDKNNRALQSAYNQIDTWADAEHLTHNVKQTAKSYYKQVYEAGSFRGKNINGILASCLFLACRSQHVGRSFAEIMSLTKVPKKEIGRTFKQLNEYLQRQSDKTNEEIKDRGGIVNPNAGPYRPPEVARAKDLIERFGGMLGLSFRVQAVAQLLAEKVVAKLPAVAGRSPLSMAGSCLYFASYLFGVGKSFAAIAEVALVSDATIKQAYKKLYEHRASLVEDDWLGPQPQVLKDRALNGDLANLPKASA